MFRERARHSPNIGDPSKKMASELAREIIDQSKPRDRPARVVVCVRTGVDGYLLMTISAPIVDGAQVFEVAFALTGKTLRYAASNLEGVATLAEGIVRHHESHGPRAQLCEVDDDGNPSTVLSWWEFTALQVGRTHALYPNLLEGDRLLQKLMGVVRTVLVL